MKISLRKANILQSSINDAINAIKVDTTIHINEFQSSVVEIAKGYQEYTNSTDKFTNLVNALYEIREKVGIENCTAGVTTLLVDIAKTEKFIQYFTKMSGETVRVEENVLIGKLDKIRARKDTQQIYGMTDTVVTSVLSQDDINLAKSKVAELKKLKQKLQDQLLELNIRTEIELSEQTVQTLQSVNIL